uniref:Decapping nuclease n=1 Tax=Corethron hystrix TaxID=216773 RepID=A0A7S1B5A0_9STRA|mmetsp:Transcript_12909/g.28516  ORF Transcript_12909/g.28516 Transcript_12909/m.28516 type:complete len:204 (+) Transcript_12909:74-685(+)
MSASFNFSVKPASFYNAPGAKKITYERPVEIGQFSKLKDGSIRLDETELKTYRAPPLSSDLSEGFESYVDPPTDEERPAPMDPIFRALERVSPPPSCDVVSFRNNLNKILQTPYNDRNDWKIGVTRRPEHLRLDVQLADAEKDAPRANDYQSRCGKLLAFWIQSYLVGVPAIVCGWSAHLTSLLNLSSVLAWSAKKIILLGVT